MPPALLKASLGSSGENPETGTLITYRLRLENVSPYDAHNIKAWDTLPNGLEFVKLKSPGMATETSPGFVLIEIDPSIIMHSGDIAYIEFEARINSIPGDYITNQMSVDWNDGTRQGANRSQVITTNTTDFPTKDPIVFPNPFIKAESRDGCMKFERLVPDSTIVIYTINGDAVRTIKAEGVRAKWDLTNNYNKKVSPGLYYYVIHNKGSKKLHKNKIFIQSF